MGIVLKNKIKINKQTGNSPFGGYRQQPWLMGWTPIAGQSERCAKAWSGATVAKMLDLNRRKEKEFLRQR